MDSGDDIQASVRISGDKSSGRADNSFRARDPLTVVIFGASGDLSKRKLIPALYHLEQEGYLPERYAVVGFSRTEMTDEAYRERMIGEIREDIPDLDADSPLFKALHYQPGNNTDVGSFQNLKAKLDALDAERDLPREPALLSLGGPGVLYPHHPKPQSRGDWSGAPTRSNGRT